MLASPIAPRRGLGSLSSFTRAPKTIPGLQIPFQGQKPHHATLKTSAGPFNNARDLKMYKRVLTAYDDDDL